VDRPTVLVPLFRHPLDDPAGWGRAAACGGSALAVVSVEHGPGDGRDPGYAAATTQLGQAGVPALGYVDLGHGTRPASAIMADVGRWAGYPVRGVFLDNTPSSPYVTGPVALAVRTARRYGLGETMVNPATVPDPLHRELADTVCVFAGSWRRWLRWSAPGVRPGDGYLVHSVPPELLDEARHMLAARGARVGLVTPLRPAQPLAGLAGWAHLLPHRRAPADRPGPPGRAFVAPADTSGS